jgi:predicted nucleic acid-binding Zn ribbon protein
VTKTHLATDSKSVACYRYRNGSMRWSLDPRRVTCLDCKKSEEFVEAYAEQAVKQAEAFAAQTPRQFEEPWGQGRIVCRKCQGDLFRDNGRSLDHYRYVCAECGETTLRLTETGMSA